MKWIQRVRTVHFTLITLVTHPTRQLCDPLFLVNLDRDGTVMMTEDASKLCICVRRKYKLGVVEPIHERAYQASA